MQIVLICPEIPNNTGCIGRLCVGLGLPLHLVKPLGFLIDDKHLKRAGLDYWDKVDLQLHDDWASCLTKLSAVSKRPIAERLFFFSARGGDSLFEVDFPADAVLVFGSESNGLPAELLNAHPDHRVRIPIKSEIRSLNIADAVCLAAYTALVSAGVALPD